ncbi:hypothetical protein [uncultured Roseobacter sp.]|uniref:hypothetical protein n=1 Tax=uncultured Roseobacter sp. TaxID=114847 RepID=UPI00260F6513|nr:hypothetical protein [uncultured Roseobacter sp.]
MALQISKAALKLPLSNPGQAGQSTERIFVHTLNADSGTDIIEMAGLPAYMVPTEVTVDTDNLAGVTTIQVGLVSGVFKEPDDARTLGSEFLAAAPSTAETSTPLLTLADIEKSMEHRGIGVQLSQNEAAAANKRIVLRVRYISM